MRLNMQELKIQITGDDAEASELDAVTRRLRTELAAWMAVRWLSLPQKL